MQSCQVLEPFTSCSSIGTGSPSFQKTTRYLYWPLLLLFFCARPNTAYCSPSSHLNGLYKSPKWKDGLRLWNKGQANFDTALTEFNARQFKTRMKKTAAQGKFFCFLMFFFSVWLAIWCLKISTFVLIKVLLTYLSIPPPNMVLFRQSVLSRSSNT